jgi:hypothetical protein
LFQNLFPFILADVSRAPLAADTPFVYLAFGFVLILIVFLLMNVDRRFREYLTRSLVRPYNFFADIRDQRIIPNVQTTLLAIAEAGAVGLFLSSIVYVYRSAYGNAAPGNLLDIANQLKLYADVPGQMLIWLALGALALILSITFVARFAAIFVRGRIYLSDTYSVVVWALLPLILLLPFDLVMPRLDPTSATFGFAAVVFGLLVLWVYQRLMKGAGVLFDVYPTVIYIYGTLLLALVSASAWIYL